MDSNSHLGIRLAIVVFVLVAAAHAIRLIQAVDVTIDGWSVPMWISVCGVIVPLVLSWLLWREK